MKEWLDQHLVEGWKDAWSDYSTAFITVLSSLTSYLASNSNEFIALLGFAPAGIAQGVAAIGIFISLMSAGMLAKLVKQKEATNDATEG